MKNNKLKHLIEKYNKPVPRYTSYPTVPSWNQNINQNKWTNLLKNEYDLHNNSEGISIYIHLPYCENLCTFCGCNKLITKNHQVEEPYINTLIKEWEIYKKIFSSKPKISEIHLGGGTPTFFSSNNLKKLIDHILKGSEVNSEFEFSFEANPNYTKKEQLETLYKVGFKRISLGIQDFDPFVQKAINRIQSFSDVEEIVNWSREIGYESINFDLVYGLPFQTLLSIENTISNIKKLSPDRIAFYSYAHVPWKSKAQRLFSEEDLPSGEIKNKLYKYGKDKLKELGYIDIGMDHFALKSDKIYQASKSKKLNRNFMGYTTSNSKILIGLGISAISDSGNCYIQNTKNIKEYFNSINKDKIPIIQGYELNSSEIKTRNHIKNLMCNYETEFNNNDNDFSIKVKENLVEMEKDALIKINKNKIIVNNIGKPFIRNICTAFDLDFIEKKESFSNSI